MKFNDADTAGSISDIKRGDVLVITREIDKGKKMLVKVQSITDQGEIILNNKMNDYFIFDMYLKGESWVWRVWNLGKIKITDITNTKSKFPRR